MLQSRELRSWFPKAWAWAATINKAITTPEQPWKHPRNEEEDVRLSLVGRNKQVSNGCAAEGTHVGGTSAGDQVETENLDQVSRTLLQRWIASLSTLELVPCELYERKKARGDGNCFFYSLLQLNNTVAANELREEMAK